MRRILPVVLFLCACSEPTAGLPKPLENPRVVSVTQAPKGAAISRVSIELSTTISDARVIVLPGGATEADVLAFAKNRATSALRAREIPSTSWLRGRTLAVQPARPLPVGHTTMIVLPEQRAPLTVELDIADDERVVARRVWSDATTVTHCADALPDKLDDEIELSPSGTRARVLRHGAVPCFDVVGALASNVLPPVIADVSVDPAPIVPTVTTSPKPEPPCPEGSYALGPLCVRVDDDRLVLVGGAETPRLLLGRIGVFSEVALLTPGARHVVRGFPPLTPVMVDLLVRDALGEQRIVQTVTTRPSRRHVVINEVLARPASGAATQRFVELVNDGDTSVDLAGLIFRDGEDEWELPATLLAPGAFALITPEGYVDGLAGEVAPPTGTERLVVDKLRLASTLAIAEPSGVVLSQFPPTTSTRTVARGRRSPETCDDAPNAFGWDARNGATPGRANAIAQP